MCTCIQDIIKFGGKNQKYGQIYHVDSWSPIKITVSTEDWDSVYKFWGTHDEIHIVQFKQESVHLYTQCLTSYCIQNTEVPQTDTQTCITNC